MEFASLGKEVVFVGMIDHVELWDTQRWKSYEQEKTPEFDRFAEQIWQKK
jgi:DNA-binding transcriptional regulator/RsmH inhibitor MraZ